MRPRTKRRIERIGRSGSALVISLLGSSYLAACGPEVVDHGDWMLGTFSRVREGAIESGLTRYTLHDDGVFEMVNIYNCGEQEETIAEHVWRHRTDGSVEVYDPDEGKVVGGYDAYVIYQTEDCGELLFSVIYRGNVIDESTFYRGVMCMQDLPPCEGGFECDTCMTVWCDGSPPPCEDEG